MEDESELNVSSAEYRVTVWDFMVEDDCETEEGFHPRCYSCIKAK
jgi:hypothetical protein